MYYETHFFSVSNMNVYPAKYDFLIFFQDFLHLCHCMNSVFEFGFHQIHFIPPRLNMALKLYQFSQQQLSNSNNTLGIK